MLTSLKLSTGRLGLAVKIRMMPAGNDMVRSPVIFTRHLGEEEVKMGLEQISLRCRTGGFGGFSREE